MKLIPLFDRVVVKSIPTKQEKLGNIILPEIAKQPEISEVIALGIGKLDGKEITFEALVLVKLAFENGLINRETYQAVLKKYGGDFCALND